MTYITKPVKMNIYVKLNLHMLVSYLLEFKQSIVIHFRTGQMLHKKIKHHWKSCVQMRTQVHHGFRTSMISNKVSAKWRIIYYILIGKWYMTYIAKPVKMNIYIKLNLHMLVSYLLEF